ncbi:hypothetical protein Acsp03_70440 [Actinomadura sp. NBRC 104412]|uniref:protein kinase domain-containing protein n=1 Tax=Actinomadura sp. NBRC 104412 TaxID=3032203 RepID=UPI0024A1263F|nr:phosphotransferase [Actinomadura sp. NBRC 104412]GLZ09578.1 hypothetical protein Acsp03_70440 [Actinomadura sp. NBRC 104412]
MKLRQPDAFGAYRVIRLLGYGMEGSTYLAVNGCGRPVAVKTSMRHKARRILGREVAALRAISPAFVPEVLADDLRADPPYYVMEFIDGVCLEDYLGAAGPLSDVEVQRLGVHLAACLAAAHSAGVAHGDIRPQNWMISGGGFYLIDWGQAVLRDDSPREFRRVRRNDLRQLGEIIVKARNGHGPYSDDSSKAIEKYTEGSLELGALSGRTREVAAMLLRRRRWWQVPPTAKRAHRVLACGRGCGRRFWAGMFATRPSWLDMG